MDLPVRVRAVILDFHGVLIDPALPGRGLAAIRDDPRAADALARLERGESGMSDFLAALPPQEPTGGHLRIRARTAVVRRVHALRAAGVRTALLTNTFRGFRGIRASCGVPDDLFDLVVESWQHGCRKPEPEIYRLAINALALPPGACVFLDDESPNVAAAIEAGLCGVLVDGESDVLAQLDLVIDAAGRTGGGRPRLDRAGG